MFEAVLVALADHGFTPTAISARLTLLSAPESIQGALAAGLLGGGSRFLGVTEDAALPPHSDRRSRPAPDRRARVGRGCRRARRRQRSAGRFVPGLGHPVHKHGDPRTPVHVPARPATTTCRAAPRAVRRPAARTRRCSANTATQRRRSVRRSARRHRRAARCRPRRGVARSMCRPARSPRRGAGSTRSPTTST